MKNIDITLFFRTNSALPDIVFMIYYRRRGDIMKFLLILIMVIGAIMLLLYFMALYLDNNKLMSLFRITMLILIMTLLVSWIVSIVLGQQFILLLGLALLFIGMYALS